MRELPVHDPMVPNGKVREDGVMLHDILLLQAKKPEEFKGEWDLFKIVKVTPGEQAFQVQSNRETALSQGEVGFRTIVASS